jgi:hypothetical protein
VDQEERGGDQEERGAIRSEEDWREGMRKVEERLGGKKVT